MSLQITVTDPANTPRADLALAISLLQRFHDDTGRADAPPIPTIGLLSGGAKDGFAAVGQPAPGTINHADLPDTGLAVVSPQQAFAGNVLPAAIATGAAGTSTTITTAPAPASLDPAAAFGAVPNVPPAPFTAAADPSSTAPAAPAPISIPAAPALVPPAPSSAPAAAGAVPAPSSPADLDKNGLPWDAEIHASSKVKNADGTWRAKRGVDPALVEQRTAQLRQLMAIPAGGAPNVPQPPTAAGVPVTIPTALAGAPSPSAPSEAPNVAPAPQPPVPPAPGAAPSDFVSLMQKLGPLVMGGKLAQPELVAICQQHGLADLTMLQPRPDLVPLVNASIDALLLTRG